MKHLKWVSVVLVLIAFGIGWDIGNLDIAFKFLSITGIPAAFAYFGGYGDGRRIADRQKVEGYLAHKWGLGNKLPVEHPYKTEPPAQSQEDK